MKKTSGAKVGLRSSVESGLSVLSAKTLSQLASCAQNRSSYALIVSVAVVPILFCCAYFDSRIVSAELLLQTANRLLLVHTSTLNLSFIRHKNEAHFRQFGERSWAPEPFQGEQTVTNNDLESGSSYQNSSINSILEKASLNYSGETKDCDLFDGRWIKDDKFHPSYSPEGCPFIDKGFRCKQNGRTDSEYFKWRWQPRGCNIPRFDARAMLVNLRGRRMVFVGDSLGRNQWESLLCMLAEAVANKSAIYEANGNPITKRKGFLSIRFDDYNCTVEYYRAPFLVRRAAAPAGSPEKVKSVLLVDAMHSTSPKWRSADVLIFNAGHWWTHEKTLKCGWYFQEGGRVVEDMKVESAFRRAMRTWGEWVKSQVDTNKTHILFRGYSPPHFRDGDWNIGGKCHHHTEPIFNSSNISIQELPWTNEIIFHEVALNIEKRITFLNITHLTSYRQDGHPSLWYTKKEPKINIQMIEDCSHWCLPGVPDIWNELLYTILSNDVHD